MPLSLLPLLLALTLLSGTGASAAAGTVDAAPALPERLSDTGFYAAATLTYSPQYPLWSDGAAKRRWISLPPGTAIDASNPDAWEFPRGTRFWKEFGFGRAIETRYIERIADGSWRYASYVWNADGSEALLAPAAGILATPATGAPGGRYDIPSQDDCRACHEGSAVPPLGFSALQLATERDQNAPNAEPKGAGDVDVDLLLQSGLLQNAGPLLQRGDAAQLSPVARSALGYLHANCGHCHNADGPLSDIGLHLAQTSDDTSVPALLTTLGQPADTRMNGLGVRIVPGRPADSLLLARMTSSNPYQRMPPLGTRIADREAVALIEQWIEQLPDLKENTL